MERQVGSRYFVTAPNAGKVLFLREAAISFLNYTRKDKGNKLEQSVYEKLQDIDTLAQLKADAIMFHHIYSNLVMLAKSCDLDKNVFDMNQHYLELQEFLNTVEHDPDAAMNKNYQVFPSEKRLYGSDKIINHRLHSSYIFVEEKIFTHDDKDDKSLYLLLALGAASMKKKLLSYAQNQLPGGKYWEPDPNIKMILKSLKPNNDICESILGLNDYLSTALPNMHQMSKSNLILAKKNKTIQWLHELPNEEQSHIVQLARKSRVKVDKACKEDDLERNRLRQEKMRKEKCRRDALDKRAVKEKERLSKLCLITTVDELMAKLSEIEEESISNSKKVQKKLAVIREQINIRKKVFGQKINVPFSSRGRKKLLSDIIKEFSDEVLCSSSSTIYSSQSLVGQIIYHKFEVEDGEKWFKGLVISFDDKTEMHEVAYDEEEDHYFFNLLEDISQGDLIVMNN